MDPIEMDLIHAMQIITKLNRSGHRIDPDDHVLAAAIIASAIERASLGIIAALERR